MVFVIFFLTIFVLTYFVTSVDISFVNSPSAFSHNIINSGNNASQQITFNLKDWIDIRKTNSDTISTLHTDDGIIPFPDTLIIIARDGNTIF